MTTKRRWGSRLNLSEVVMAVIGIIWVAGLVAFVVLAEQKGAERFAALAEGCADGFVDEVDGIPGLPTTQVVSIDGELVEVEIKWADRDYVIADGEVVCAAAEINKEDRS